MTARKKKPSARDELLDHRLPDPTDIGAGEFAKSRLTRIRIMEAAVEVLATAGYSSMSTTEVARRAGLTRAAMLYHFPSRMSLIEAVVHFVTRKRVEMYGDAMSEIAHDEQYFDHAIELAWQQLNTPEFLAFSELSTAARTDPELSAVFTPALAEFDRARRAMALKLFPSDHVSPPWFDLRRDITRFLLEGLAQQGGMAFDADRRRAELIEFLKALAMEPEAEAVFRKAKERAARRKRRAAKS